MRGCDETGYPPAADEHPADLSDRPALRPPASKEGRPSVLGKRSVFDLAELPLAGKRWSAAARAQLNRTRFHDEFAVEARPGSHSVLDHTAE